MPNVGATIYAFGIVIGMQCITSYIMDAYSLYAASVIAVTTVLRSLRDFDFVTPVFSLSYQRKTTDCIMIGFLLFAPCMYRTMNQGWSNSILALMTIEIDWPAPYLLWNFGAFFRRKSSYVANVEY
jgi:hypothetical protein